jgi:hypothetical protein
VAEEVEQLQHQDERLRQDDAVAHRREPHGGPARTLAGRERKRSRRESGGKEEGDGRWRREVGSIYKREIEEWWFRGAATGTNKT